MSNHKTARVALIVLALIVVVFWVSYQGEGHPNDGPHTIAVDCASLQGNTVGNVDNVGKECHP